MTHPTNTVLTVAERHALCRKHTDDEDGEVFAYQLVLDVERAVIEKLGTGDAVPVAYYYPDALVARPSGWESPRIEPRVTLAPYDHFYESANGGYAKVQPLYDAAALAAARQLGRNEGREEARAELAGYTPGMGEAANAYHASFQHAHSLPAQWRWQSVWDAMLAARQPTQKEAT